MRFMVMVKVTKESEAGVLPKPEDFAAMQKYNEELAKAGVLLAAEGLTLGHFPQSFQYASIGGFAVTRSSGQSSAGYGRFDSLVVGLTVATPRGRMDLGSAPANAAGPDLRQLFLGSEGTFGVITAVTVRVRRLPEVTVYEGWRWPSFADGAAAPPPRNFRIPSIIEPPCVPRAPRPTPSPSCRPAPRVCGRRAAPRRRDRRGAALRPLRSPRTS